MTARKNLDYEVTNPKLGGYTKEELVLVKNLWATKNTYEIAKHLGRTPQSITYIAREMRIAGVDVPKKRQGGNLRHLIKETFGLV